MKNRSLVLFLIFLVFVPQLFAQNPVRVSTGKGGVETNGGSSNAKLSSDGRYVLFKSMASNIVDNDNNGGDYSTNEDVFVYDRTTGETKRVNVSSSGEEANGKTLYASISSDGRYVTFDSEASNLLPNDADSNGKSDIFLRDLQTETTTRIGLAVGGDEMTSHSSENEISGNGRYVVFTNAADNAGMCKPGSICIMRPDLFIRDLQSNTTTRLVKGDLDDWEPSVSSDGGFVAFSSNSRDIMSGNDSAAYHIYLIDRNSGDTLTRISVTPEGAPSNGSSVAPSISSDGRYVAYYSGSTDLVSGDTNEKSDVFVYDRVAQTTTRVSVDSNGNEADNGGYRPSISSDGRYVTFQSSATDLVAGDENSKDDIFVHDRTTGTTTRVSKAVDGSEADGTSEEPAISADGRYVAYGSHATNLVTGDTADVYDVFQVDLQNLPESQLNVTARVKLFSANKRRAKLTCKVKEDGQAASGKTVTMEKSRKKNGNFKQIGSAKTTRVKGSVKYSLRRTKRKYFVRCQSGEQVSSAKVVKKVPRS